MLGGELVDWLMDLGVPFGRFQKDKWFHITKDGSAPGPHIGRALSKKIADDNINYRLNSEGCGSAHEGRQGCRRNGQDRSR